MSGSNENDNSNLSGRGEQTARLVTLAQNGDHTAFHRLADRYQPEIFRMMYYRTRSRMDAEDLTQDVFLRAYKQIGRIESPALFRSWLYRIAVNRVKDFYRRQRIKSLVGWVSMDEEGFRESEEMVVAPDAEERLDRRDFWNRVEGLLERLSKKEREAFLLRFFDQLSIQEMTTAMGKNESTVKTHLYRALNKIKAAMAETPDKDDFWESI
ncbi:RNA polymerase sigma factor [Desulfatitalea tepidiphila]|uniref:RNA polymerase sigma factor n=1 Tax=Desulfatitalea tepidiphila TaxID=1185843 RepID=UPI0006B54BDD|nr:RNA polymerase sigma factor [Desulfatitalea tepidiphila]